MNRRSWLARAAAVVLAPWVKPALPTELRGATFKEWEAAGDHAVDAMAYAIHPFAAPMSRGVHTWRGLELANYREIARVLRKLADDTDQAFLGIDR